MFSAVFPVPRMVPGPEWVLNRYLWKEGIKERKKERHKERRNKGKKEGREEKRGEEEGKKDCVSQIYIEALLFC